MATFNYEQFQCCFLNWINQQQEDLEELVQALETNPGNEKLQILTEKGIKHFEEYYEKRARMSEHDAPSFLSPSWCTSFENAFLWIGGCRPSLSIRLVYSVCGSEMDAQLVEFLRGEIKGNLAEISAQQLHSINTLHGNTVREEDKLSNTMASLQANGYSSFFTHFHFVFIMTTDFFLQIFESGIILYFANLRTVYWKLRPQNRFLYSVLIAKDAKEIYFETQLPLDSI